MWGFSRFSFESFFTSRNVGFFPFQFRIVLAVLPSFEERRLAIPLSVSLKNSRFGDQIHENFATISKFGRQYESTTSQK